MNFAGGIYHYYKLLWSNQSALFYELGFGVYILTS
uniref:Uncharacterized protein n=1 Tax=Arundo donax TaxID=35708 RepID=A0A0A8YEA8_ARUDO